MKRSILVTAATLSLVTFTTPADALIWGGFDTTRVNYAGGVLTGTEHDGLRAAITGGGDVVGTLTGTLTASYLNTIDVFYTSLLTNNGVPLSNAEQTALQAWVGGGGVLIVSADIFNLPGYNSFTNFAGVTNFTNAGSGPFMPVGTHPMVAGITSFNTTSNVSFSYNQNNATLLVNNANVPWAVALDSTSGWNGGGCILVFGDHNSMTDNYINQASNTVWANNMVAWASSCGGGAPNGSPCNTPNDCSSGFCVDGVCCDSACGLGASDDCQACSVNQGAMTDGVCAPLAAATNCRPAAGLCDADEFCDGTNVACPADVLATQGTECRLAVDVCDVVETCDGVSPLCPADALEPAGTECRAAADVCDVAETCDGTTVACPSDALAPAGTECRASADDCDAAETCDGVAAACPADMSAADGTACDDGDTCTDGDVCTAGVCQGQDSCGTGGGGGMSGTGGSDPTTSSSSSGSGGNGDDTTVDGGCGCRTSGSASSSGAWWLLGLAALLRRRRRRARG
ncbi:MAG: MYXO-CTERM sorting domain-containing protein [Polyangiaceae bacterium]